MLRRVTPWGRFAKRTFDVLAAACGLAALSPLFGLVAILLKRESPGPVFYRGPRMGMAGKEFGILKFRTMHEEAASYNGPRVTAQDDARVTTVGRWLRDTKLNELPQLWNVLIGEMSLVGPRPEDPEIAKSWPPAVKTEVLSVRPGITSPASVIYRDEERLLKSASVMDDYVKNLLPAKLRLDQLYVRNRNFVSDLDVIFSTLLLLLPGMRQAAPPTETLFNGPLSRLTRRYVSWFTIDTVTAFAATTIAGFVERMADPLNLGLQQSIAVAVLLAVTFSLVNAALGLGRVAWQHAPPAYAYSLAFSSGVSTALLLFLDAHLWPGHRFVPPDLIPLAGLMAWLGFMAVRYRERLVTGLAAQWLLLRPAARQSIGERVLIVGAGDCAMLAVWLLQRSRMGPALSVIGMVDDDPLKQGLTVDGLPVHGLTRRIPELVKKFDVGLILFAIERIASEEQERVLRLCEQTPARVVMVPDLLTMFRQALSQPVQAA